MENPIKKLIQKIRSDYNYVADYRYAENFLRRVGLPKGEEPIKWGKKRPFIVILFKRFFRLRDRIWSKY
jgi:hypothetical protein